MHLAGKRNVQTGQAWIWRSAPGRPAFARVFGFWGYFYFAAPAGGD